MKSASIPDVISGPTGTPPKKAAAATAPIINDGITSLCPPAVKYLRPTPLKYVVKNERAKAIIPAADKKLFLILMEVTLPFAIGINMAAVRNTNPIYMPFLLRRGKIKLSI